MGKQKTRAKQDRVPDNTSGNQNKQKTEEMIIVIVHKVQLRRTKREIVAMARIQWQLIFT